MSVSHVALAFLGTDRVTLSTSGLAPMAAQVTARGADNYPSLLA